MALAVVVYNSHGRQIDDAPAPLSIGKKHGLDVGDKETAALVFEAEGRLQITARRLPKCREIFLCAEDLSARFRLKSQMALRVGHMTRGPMLYVTLEGTTLVLTQSNYDRRYEATAGRRIEIGRGGAPQDKSLEHYQIHVPAEIIKTVSRKHAIVEWDGEGWFLVSHPMNPAMKDIARERSTWLRLEPGAKYDMHVGARDGMVGLVCDIVPLLLQRRTLPEVPILQEPENGLRLSVVMTSGNGCKLRVHPESTGFNLSVLAASKLGVPVDEQNLVFGQHAISCDMSLVDIPGLRDAAGGDNEAVITLVRRDNPLFTEWIAKVEDDKVAELSLAPPELLRDRLFMGRAVSITGHAIASADEALLEDASLLHTAVAVTPSSIVHLYPFRDSDELWTLALSMEPDLKVYRAHRPVH